MAGEEQKRELYGGQPNDGLSAQAIVAARAWVEPPRA